MKRLVLALVLLALVVPRAFAGAGDARTLVVRGIVLAPDGSPLPGAHITARGSANLSALTDPRGRYTLSVPIGSAASLRRGAFSLEVRAEESGRRLALGAGAPALAVEVSLAPGGSRVRVRSNSQEATSAIATAFAQDRATTAWVEADFGGAARPSGSLALTAVDEVRLDGGASPATGESGAVAPRRPRVDSLPHAAAPPAPAPAPAPPADRARRDSLARARAAAAAEAKAFADSVQRMRRGPRPLTNSASAEERRVRARLDSLMRVRSDSASRARANVRDSVARARQAAASAAQRAWSDSLARAHAAQLDAQRRQQAEAKARRDSVRASRTAARTGVRAPKTPAPPVVSVTEAPPKPAPAPAPAPARATAPARAVDSCACHIRGTVEIEWDRPLERNFPIGITLEGPVSQRADVDMFIGSPREFRFGPVPCGDYRLVVHPESRLRYTLARGDSVFALPCRGATQARLVLVPAKR